MKMKVLETLASGTSEEIQVNPAPCLTIILIKLQSNDSYYANWSSLFFFVLRRPIGCSEPA